MKTQALSKKFYISLGPQTALTNDYLHALKPAKHGEVIFRKVEWLGIAVWKHAIVHTWTVRVVRPPFLWACETSQ